MINNPYIPASVFTAADMSTAVGGNGVSLLSDVINKAGYVNIGFQFAWTGTPTGTLKVWGNYSPDFSSAIAYTLTGLTPAFTQPAGSAAQSLFDMAVNAPYAWVTYAKASGSGLLTVKVVVTL